MDAREMNTMMSGLLDEITRSRTESLRSRAGRSTPSGASPGDGSNASSEEVPCVTLEPSRDMHVDRAIDHLQRFEDTSYADRAAPGCRPLLDVSPSAAAAGSSTRPALDLGAKETREGAGVYLEPLREALKDPWERLLANLSVIDGPPNFTFLAGPTSRVALELLVQTYGSYGPMVEFATDWVPFKELNRNRIGHETRLHRMALDRVREAPPDFIQTAGCEIWSARLYARRRAFKDASCINDCS